MLIDKFLDEAIEIDVDALFDGEELYLGGVMEHIEEAGIHSGDSACALPPITLGSDDIKRIRAATEAIARGVGVRGLLNVQYAMSASVLYVLEANPRASRTVPFVSKATAVPLAKAAARVMMGTTVAALRAEGMLPADGDGGTLPLDAPIAVKEAVLPFNRFRGVDIVLGPGDALHRRGHGHRRVLRHGLRQVAGRRLRLAADQGTSVRLGRQPGQTRDDLPGQGARRPRFRDPGHRGNGRGAAP